MMSLPKFKKTNPGDKSWADGGKPSVLDCSQHQCTTISDYKFPTLNVEVSFVHQPATARLLLRCQLDWPWPLFAMNATRTDEIGTQSPASEDQSSHTLLSQRKTGYKWELAWCQCFKAYAARSNVGISRLLNTRDIRVTRNLE